jgi:hypothetical protein
MQYDFPFFLPYKNIIPDPTSSKKILIRPDPDPEHCFDGLWQENAGLQERAWWGHSTATDLSSFESYQQQCQLISANSSKTQKMRAFTKNQSITTYFLVESNKTKTNFQPNIIVGFSISVFSFFVIQWVHKVKRARVKTG